MIALRVPWSCQSLQEIDRKIRESKYPPLPAHYSIALRNIVQQCLQKNPTQRPSVN